MQCRGGSHLLKFRSLGFSRTFNPARPSAGSPPSYRVGPALKGQGCHGQSQVIKRCKWTKWTGWLAEREFKWKGRPESNTVIFHSNPPKLPGHFGAVLEADGHSPNPSRAHLYSAYPTPIKIPWCFQAHMNLSFRSPTPLGLK